MRAWTTILIGIACVLGTASSAGGSTPGGSPVPADETLTQAPSTAYRLRPDEVSHYSVAQAFFLRVHHLAQVPHDSQPFLRLLKTLGLPKDPEVTQFLLAMAENGMAIIRTQQIDPGLEGEAYDQYQFDALRGKADRLGAAFRELLDGLIARGIDIAGVLAYCEEQIRPTISVTTTDLLGDSYFWVAVSVFDQHLVGLEGHDP